MMSGGIGRADYRISEELFLVGRMNDFHIHWTDSNLSVSAVR